MFVRIVTRSFTVNRKVDFMLALLEKESVIEQKDDIIITLEEIELEIKIEELNKEIERLKKNKRS